MAYAITFDFEISKLEHYYPGTYNNAYKIIRAELEKSGFSWTQGSVYFGNESINAVTCVMVVQQIGQNFPWFVPSLKDIRMLRIEENNDLLPALNLYRPKVSVPITSNESIINKLLKNN